jgi:hypothetical protein
MKIKSNQLKKLIKESIEEEVLRQFIRESLMDKIKGLFGGGKISKISNSVFPNDVLDGGSSPGNQLNLSQLKKDLIGAGYDPEWSGNIVNTLSLKFKDEKKIDVGDDLEFRQLLMSKIRQEWMHWFKNEGLKTLKEYFSSNDIEDENNVKKMRAFFTHKSSPGFHMISSPINIEGFLESAGALKMKKMQDNKK